MPPAGIVASGRPVRAINPSLKRKEQEDSEQHAADKREKALHSKRHRSESRDSRQPLGLLSVNADTSRGKSASRTGARGDGNASAKSDKPGSKSKSKAANQNKPAAKQNKPAAQPKVAKPDKPAAEPKVAVPKVQVCSAALVSILRYVLAPLRESQEEHREGDRQQPWVPIVEDLVSFEDLDSERVLEIFDVIVEAQEGAEADAARKKPVGEGALEGGEPIIKARSAELRVNSFLPRPLLPRAFASFHTLHSPQSPNGIECANILQSQSIQG